MKIEVIGPGCPKCKTTASRVEQALDQLDGVDATVEKIADDMAIIDRGVMHTPAVAIDGEIVVEGEIPSVDQLLEHLQAV